MAREKSASVSFFQEFFDPGIYKRNQGRVARQVTFATLAVMVGFAAWRLSVVWSGEIKAYEFGAPLALLLVGWWTSYRAVNLSKFADFLISVEGEMAKVSWPSQGELIRSSIVVIVTIFFLATTLLAYDLIWNELLKLLGVLQVGGG